MAGLFDDVLQPAPAVPKGGLFDDVLPSAPSFANVRSGSSSTEAPAYAAQRFDRQPIESRIARSNTTRELIGLEPIEAPQPGSLLELFNRGIAAIPEHVGSLARLGPGLADAVAKATGVPQLAYLTPTGAPPVRKALNYLSDVLSEPARKADEVQYGIPSVQTGDLTAALGLTDREMSLSDLVTGQNTPPPSLLERAGTVGRFVLEQGARSIPEMLGVVAAPTAYIGGRTQEIAENRAANLGQGLTPDLPQYAVAAPAAAIESLLERYTTGRLLPGGGAAAGNVLGRIGQEVGVQAGLGGLEEVAPYLAEQAGTQRPATAGGALDQFIAGALAEGALGGAVQGGKEIAGRLPPRTFEDIAPPRREVRAEPIEPKAVTPRAPVPEVQAAAPEPAPTAKPRVSLAEVQAEQARRSDEAARQAEIEAAQRVLEQGPGAGVDFGKPDRAPRGTLDEAIALSDADYLARVNPSRETTDETTSNQLAEELQDRDVPSRATPVGEVNGITLHADGDYLYAADGDRVVGVLGAKPSGNEFAVDPEYRGKGIGTAMMRELLVRDPFALSGGLSPSAEATRLAALRQLREGAVIPPLYHGSNQRFGRFDKSRIGGIDSGKLGRGAYLTSSEKWAKAYAGAAKRRAGGEEVVMRASTRLRNPIRIDSTLEPLWDRLRSLSEEFGVTSDPVSDRSSNAPNPKWSAEFADAAQARGYDGVVLNAGDQTEVVVFDPGNVAFDDGTPSVGTKNAAVAARRELEGRDPILKEAARSNEDTLSKAFTDLANNPSRGDEVVVKLANAGKQGISLDDEATLLVHMSDLRQQRDRAADVLADPKASEEAKEVATREYGELEGRLNSAEQAAAASGREWGRFGQFRQRMLADDFTLEALERKERARLQRPLERKEAQSVKVMAEKIAASQKRVEAAESRAAQVQSEAAYDALIRQLSTVPKTRPTLAKLKAAADESTAELNRILGRTTTSAGVNPVAFYHAARIGAYHVANGLTKFADWASKMRADLGELAERLPLPDVFKAALAQAKRPIAAGATVADVVAKIEGEPTGKDVRAVAEAHVRAGLRGAPEVFQATAESLGITEQQVRDLFTQTENGAPRTVDEAKAEVARLRKELQREAREAARPEREEASQLKAIRKRINALQDRIAAGDFAKPERVQKTLTAAVEKARFEEYQAKEEFFRHQFEEELKARPPLSKALGYGKDAINLLQAYKTSFDAGAFLKQGLIPSVAHPIRTIKSIPDVVKATLSEEGYHAVQQSILRRNTAAKMKRHGVQLTDIGKGPLSKVEEQYATRLIAKLPKKDGQRIRNALRTAVNLGHAPVRASGRLHATILNLMRADTFDMFENIIGDSITAKESQHAAKIANVATGRGYFGKNDNAGDIINATAFAPRLYMSRMQLLTGQVFAGGSLRTKKILAMEYARAATTLSVLFTLASLLRDPEDEKKGIKFIELDPRSSDFGKLRFGDTRLDLGGGLLQFAVLFARMAAGETVTTPKPEDEDKRPLRPLRPQWRLSDAIPELSYTGAKLGKGEYAGRDIQDVLTTFVRSKLRPIAGSAWNVVTGKDYMGQPTDLKKEAVGLIAPMTPGDVVKIMEANGVPRGAAISALVFLGGGASVYADTPIADIDAQYAESLKELKKARKEGKGLEPEGFKATEKGVTALNKAVKRLAEAEAINYADLWATAEVAPEVAEILGDSPRGTEKAPVRLVRRVHEAVIKAREEAKRGAIRQLGQTPVDEEAQAGG